MEGGSLIVLGLPEAMGGAAPTACGAGWLMALAVATAALLAGPSCGAGGGIGGGAGMGMALTMPARVLWRPAPFGPWGLGGLPSGGDGSGGWGGACVGGCICGIW